MPVDKPKAGETQEQYLKYCIPEEINNGMEQDQAAAVCYSYWDKSVEMQTDEEIAALPEPKSSEGREQYIRRCLPNIYKEGGKYDQRVGTSMCATRYEKSNALASRKLDSFSSVARKIKLYFGDETPNSVPIKMAEVGPRGGIKESDKAPKSDTANPNPKGEGTAKGDASGKSAKVTAEQEKTLEGKVKDFNEKESNTKNGNATLGQLKSVFQRGLGAFNTSHSPVVKSAEQWAYARVNAYLYLLKNGRPENPKYDTDFDLLPKGHPKANK